MHIVIRTDRLQFDSHSVLDQPVGDISPRDITMIPHRHAGLLTNGKPCLP